MRQELVRINSTDGIEMPGILYKPDKDTKKMVLHVHGLNGNFYENRFIDILAKIYTNRNIAFLTFNNRGKDYISEFLKGKNTEIIGGCLERFKDCVLDIEGAIDWAKRMNYDEIILEGHSYGCNKVIYYYTKKKDRNIKQIILLAPCEIPAECKKFLTKEEYEKAKNESTQLVKDNRENELIDFSVTANGKIAAGTYYYDFLPGGANDFIRYSDGINGKSETLNNIEIPVLITFGDKDECVLTESMDIVKKYLTNNIKYCNIQIIEGADHSYGNKENELGEIIDKNLGG